jgi:hypothetical protein
MRRIFEKKRLTPRQLRAVAQRRFGDADCLRRTGDNARANGVFYLGGFVIECLLKAKMLDRFASMQTALSPEKLSESDRRIWSLIYRSHDLKQMLFHLPELERKLMLADRNEGTRRLEGLRSICQGWTIFARYSPHSEKMKDAGDFLDEIQDLKEWLR